MSTILAFISNKAFNSPPGQTSALADPPCYLNQEIKGWTDRGETRNEFDDAAMDFEGLDVCLVGHRFNVE